MNKLLYTIIYFLSISNLFAQVPEDALGTDGFDEKYLEHLIKTGIDSVRQSHGCDPLINDSILYVAANHHANYMRRKNRISHEEPDRKDTKTPQLRADFFGAKNYFVGENVLFTYYNRTVNAKNGAKYKTYTYKSLANGIVMAWANSPGHFKNMIHCDYQITGVGINVDKKTRKVYACQKFAKVRYKFQFEESEILFPYSTYKAPKIVNSFYGIVPELQEHEHEWDLAHNEQEKCNHCKELLNDQPSIILKKENGYFVLRIEESEFVKQLLRNPNDGFAVEIVDFDDYSCGNPDYYVKPSRRNKQCLISGKLLKPVYKEQLYKGFKKRKKKKDVKFVSYLFGADSINFIDRFKQFKFEKYSSKYFEIRLGRVPRNSYWAHNLVYIQDGEICYTDFFTSYCGSVSNDTLATKQLFPVYDTQSYEFATHKKAFKFTIPFEKNKYEYKEKDIRPFVKSISNLSYNVDSIHIIAYSSVEGNQKANEVLQVKRAKSIAGVFKKHQQNHIPEKIESHSSWTEFLSLCKKIPRLKFLNKMSRSNLIKYVNEHATELEAVFKKQRKADIELFCTLDNNRKNLTYLINREYKELEDSLFKASDKQRMKWINQMTDLYLFCYQKVQANEIDVSTLIGLKMPKGFYKNDVLAAHYYLFRYLYEDHFNENLPDKDLPFFSDMEMIYHRNKQEQEYFDYNYLQLKSNLLLEQTKLDQNEVQTIFSKLETMKNLYEANKAMANQIDRINYNLNFLLLNKVFINKPKENIVDAIKSIEQIKEYYEKNNIMNAEKALILGKAAVYYKDISYALNLMHPFMEDDDVMGYYTQLFYRHPSDGGESFVKRLLNAKERMSEESWCAMFMKTCGIPFQILDSKEVYDVFCETCLDKNERMIQIMD